MKTNRQKQFSSLLNDDKVGVSSDDKTESTTRLDLRATKTNSSKRSFIFSSKNETGKRKKHDRSLPIAGEGEVV